MAFTITCPVCGKRNGYEFRYGGVDKGPRPDEEGLTPEKWCEYVHMNECVAGIQKEWWFHRDGCGSRTHGLELRQHVHGVHQCPGVVCIGRNTDGAGCG